jgi:hypothetical protein
VKSVYDIARQADWPHGEKHVIERETRLGWAEHALACADLTRQFGSIILLEDDLYVSPAFYDYVAQSLEYYSTVGSVAGVSLYRMTLNENPPVPLPFYPIDDGGDVFFLQKGLPWGFAFTHRQWEGFSGWYRSKAGHMFVTDELPSRVLSWPDTSLSKYFIKYLKKFNRYVVYPRRSLSTNFGDAGLHHKCDNRYFQAPLQLSGRSWNFTFPDDSVAVYDAHFEILPEKLDVLSNQLRDYPYVVDLYATRDLGKVDTDWVLTTIPPAGCVRSFARELVPMEMNVVENLRGEGIWFCEKEALIKSERNRQDEDRMTLDYFYPNVPFDDRLLQELVAQRRESLEKEECLMRIRQERATLLDRCWRSWKGGGKRSSLEARLRGAFKAARVFISRRGSD